MPLLLGSSEDESSNLEGGVHLLKGKLVASHP